MRISTRLALVLGATFAVIMAAYAAVTLEQRPRLLRGALTGETETLASTLRIVTDNAVRDRRFRDLGRVLAGGVAGDPACPQRIHGRAAAEPGGARGWADCGTRVRWVALPAAAGAP